MDKEKLIEWLKDMIDKQNEKLKYFIDNNIFGPMPYTHGKIEAYTKLLEYVEGEE